MKEIIIIVDVTSVCLGFNEVSIAVLPLHCSIIKCDNIKLFTISYSVKEMCGKI